MKRLFLLLPVFLVMTDLQAQKLVADTTRSQLLWTGEKVLGEHNGTIKLQSGWIDWQDNRIKAGEFMINMASIREAQNNKMLEGHLKSDDFFGVQKYPSSKLVITNSTQFEGGKATVDGILTIKDVSNPIQFKVSMQKKDDGTWFFSNITVDRSKYNIRYGSGTFFDNLGDKTIYDEFKLKVNLLME